MIAEVQHGITPGPFKGLEGNYSRVRELHTAAYIPIVGARNIVLGGFVTVLRARLPRNLLRAFVTDLVHYRENTSRWESERCHVLHRYLSPVVCASY